MCKQWKKHIWSNIKYADFHSVVEIAAGHGRNTEMLIKQALESSPLGQVLATSFLPSLSEPTHQPRMHVDRWHPCATAGAQVLGSDCLHMGKRSAKHSVVSEGHNLQFRLNNCSTLPMVPDSSATLVYSWDPMVHFPAWAVAQYLKEIAQILKHPAASAFFTRKLAAMPSWRTATL